MSHIAEEYAKSLGTKIGRPEISDHFFPIAFDKYITLQTTKKFESRNYSFWPLAVSVFKKIFRGYKDSSTGHGRRSGLRKC